MSRIIKRKIISALIMLFLVMPIVIIMIPVFALALACHLLIDASQMYTDWLNNFIKEL